MSRERKRNRETLLDRYRRQQGDPAHEERYQSWLKAWLGNSYRAPHQAAVGPLARAHDEHLIDEAMAEVEAYNRAHGS